MRTMTAAFLAMCLAGMGAGAMAASEDELIVTPATASTGSELEGLFPVSVGGHAVSVKGQNGAEWVARFDPGSPQRTVVIAAAEALAASAELMLDDLEVATTSIDLGEAGDVTISALRVPGSRAYDLIGPAADMLAGRITQSPGWTWAADRWVAYAVDADAPELGLSVVYPAVDTVWMVEADLGGGQPVIERVESIVAALPPQPGPVGPIVTLTQRVELPGLDMAVQLPEGWTYEALPADPAAQPDPRDPRLIVPMRGGLIAEGPASPWLGDIPRCALALLGPGEPTSGYALISRAIAGNRCYVVDRGRDGLIRARLRPSACGRVWAPSQGGVEHYAIGHDDQVAYLRCSSKEPPGVRSAAIAESIEFLDAEE